MAVHPALNLPFIKMKNFLRNYLLRERKHRSKKKILCLINPLTKENLFLAKSIYTKCGKCNAVKAGFKTGDKAVITRTYHVQLKTVIKGLYSMA